MQVDQFYNEISHKYTSLLERTIPNYKEMISNIFHFIPYNFQPNKILELGCGTGNLSELIIRQFPGAKITLVDISEQMLDSCSRRFEKSANISYKQSKFENLSFQPAQFDLVVSSISIHHLTDSDKLDIFKKVNNWLPSKGLFIFSDQFRGSTDQIYQKHIADWREKAISKGATEEDWNLWMDHQNMHDHHASIENHFEWMKIAGFRNTDILWRKLLWAVLYAEKL